MGLCRPVLFYLYGESGGMVCINCVLITPIAFRVILGLVWKWVFLSILFLLHFPIMISPTHLSLWTKSNYFSKFDRLNQ